MAWASLLTFTIHCWFKERKQNIELFAQIASYTWIKMLLGIDAVDVSQNYRFSHRGFYGNFLLLSHTVLQIQRHRRRFRK